MGCGEASESKAIPEPTEHLTILSDSGEEKSAPTSATLRVVTSDIIFVSLAHSIRIRALRILELLNIHVFRACACFALNEPFAPILQHCDKALVILSGHLNETYKLALQSTRKNLLKLFAHELPLD